MNNPYLMDPDNNLAVSEIETNHPSHYNQNKIEHWDFVNNLQYGYLLGCASKYVFRNRFKGTKQKDLDKVIEYTNKYVEQHKFDDTLMKFTGEPRKYTFFDMKDLLTGLNQNEIDVLANIDRLSICKSQLKAKEILKDIADGVEKLR